LAFLVALFLIFKLTEIEHGRSIAHITIWTICFFPSAAFWGAVYTESLFLALLAATFLMARNKRWVLCSIFAAAAALTRNPGALLAIALYLEVREDNPALKFQMKKWYVPIAPLLTFTIVQVFFWWKFKNPVSGLISQEFFSRKLMWPWEPIINDFQAIFYSGHELHWYFFTFTSLFITILAFFSNIWIQYNT
jgi:hypothetical protein